MIEPRRWMRESWVPIVVGLLWLRYAAGFGIFGFVLSVIPGCLLLASGVSTLLYPGDPRIAQFVAAGGFLGVPFALPAFFFGGFWTGLVLLLGSAASFVSAGAISVRQEPHVDDVPEPRPSLGLAAQVAVDDALLASMMVSSPIVGPGRYDTVRSEVHAARELFRERGWLEDPAKYHDAPPPLEAPTLQPRKVGRFEFEHLTFDSGYEPHAGEPGGDRWLSYAATRTAHAWVMRHAGPPRPWLVCIHGYQMGIPLVDLSAFRALGLHHKHGLNLALPVLPLHGPRKIGRRSGDGFLAADFLDSVHAEAQAMWDIRRLLSWIRAQGDGPVGVYGLSLGGYNTALLASLDDGLACAVPGIPATDFTRLIWRHGPTLQIRYAERKGVVHDEVAEVLRVVSPLALSPRVPRGRRYIFAAVADRLVPADQPRDLWLHWERPRIEWYQGAHLTFRAHPQVERLLMDALRESGLVAAAAA